ncbi:hypothetical protein Taro_003921 [Colocasia esculenta]|uniref:Uncharacterized protein n=1 Tax=Colocasia esculenta TaxID=4460 RepID=A0A843TKQ2_COLES|nr:hypothetical protein [Colocasia esculenta]
MVEWLCDSYVFYVLVVRCYGGHVVANDRSTQDEGKSTLDLAPRTVCLKNGTAGRRKMRAGRHWIISQNSLFSELGQEVDTTTRAGRHHIYPVSTHSLGQVDTKVFQCRHCTPCQIF